MSRPISYLNLPKLLAIAPEVLHVSTGDRPPFSVVMEIAGVLAVVAFDEADARDRPNGRRIELPRPEEVVATTDEIQAKQRSAASAGAAAECRLILVMTIIIGLIQLIATSRKPHRRRSSGDNRPESISYLVDTRSYADICRYDTTLLRSRLPWSRSRVGFRFRSRSRSQKP